MLANTSAKHSAMPAPNNDAAIHGRANNDEEIDNRIHHHMTEPRTRDPHQHSRPDAPIGMGPIRSVSRLHKATSDAAATATNVGSNGSRYRIEPIVTTCSTV